MWRIGIHYSQCQSHARLIGTVWECYDMSVNGETPFSPWFGMCNVVKVKPCNDCRFAVEKQMLYVISVTMHPFAL